MALDALLKTGDRVRLVVAAIFFSQVFEKSAKELVKIRCRYVCYVKTTTYFSLAIGVKSLPVWFGFFDCVFRFLAVDEVVNFLARMFFSAMINVFVRFFLKYI